MADCKGEGPTEQPKPSAPLLYLVAAFVSYVVSFSFAVRALVADLTGNHSGAARLCISPWFGPSCAFTYLLEIFFAKVLGWVSWYGRPPAQIIRHHSAFIVVMSGWCWMWIVDQLLISQWFAEHWPFRVWLITAGLTNLNEVFIVFQNFMYYGGIKPITKKKVFWQRCLALGVMTQAIILGMPSGLYLLMRVLMQEWRRRFTPQLAAFSIGVASQFLGQLFIQLPDCFKLIAKLRGEA